MVIGATESAYVSPTSLSFLEIGSEPSGNSHSTLLFIHGSESSKETWNPVIDRLKNQHHIVAIDLPGHGESPLDDENLTLNKVIAAIHKFVTQKKLSPFVLVGHSMGARVAVTFAAEYPELIQGLLIEDMEMVPREKVKLNEKEKNFLKSFNPRHKNIESLRQELKNYGYDEKRIDSWQEQGKIKYLSKENVYLSGVNPYVTVLAKNAISASDAALLSFARLKNHPFPVYLLRAEEDSSVTTRGVMQMKELHPRLIVEEVKGSSHSIHKTATAVFTEKLNDFIKNTDDN